MKSMINQLQIGLLGFVITVNGLVVLETEQHFQSCFMVNFIDFDYVINPTIVPS